MYSDHTVNRIAATAYAFGIAFGLSASKPVLASAIIGILYGVGFLAVSEALDWAAKRGTYAR